MLRLAQIASDSEDHDGVWKAVRDHGNEGRDDEWCYWWCDGRWRGWGGKVISIGDRKADKGCILKRKFGI